MSNDKEITGFLKKVPLLSRLSTGHLRAIAKSCTERSFVAGDTILRQGNPGVGLFIITSGKVKVQKENDDGTVFEIATHTAGEVVGEMSVLDGAARSASVIALEDTATLVLPSWAFNAFLQSHPEVALEILPIVVHRFRETNNALIHMQSSQR
ncbi:Crp/Fnr family transcriptional regulator [Spirochaeta africana]|uniref:Cyclic nucleotide-binding protein n=1 Tax=Spirochaeta africana (strain ATCC 700263 / DSM 8902 / Z-7692) TaxID=889378 RepID=H9UFW4_SPIAZ|nr:cyclic nucleotide-binding domain-containing protein [Spirochaeta africana]AFG36407.1 cyclic nucleotide-binding protein [Spirochaeta africana DSM 8902]